MGIFNAIDFDNHEQIAFVSDGPSGLRAIIAIHNTNLGPALGGVRMQPYRSEEDAVRDVLRLSKGMTYKAATLGVSLGGGKAVVIGDPRTVKKPELMQALGIAIDHLNARYICGEDIGTNPDDMREIRTNTECVTCLRKEDGGYGDPAWLTALGVFSAMRAGLHEKFGTDDPADMGIAVQGVGNVGFELCKLLTEAGSRVVATDVTPNNLTRAEQLGCDIVAPEKIYDADVDVFAPCAIGATLNDSTIPRLKAKVIAGAANNQLEAPRHSALLVNNGITYLPDYVANGGGLISCAAEWYKSDFSEIPDRVRRIYDTSLNILQIARAEKIPPNEAADRIAETRFKEANC